MDEESPEKWYVVRSQTKRERAAAAYLRKELGLEVVAPQVSYIKSTRRGKVQWREAMFPGYLFAKFDRDGLERAVCYAPGVLKLVRFGDWVPDLDEAFVLGLKDVIGGEEELQLDRTIKVGETYEVADGPMRGQEGVVLEVLPGKDRVKLLLDFIGSDREIDVDLYSLILPSRPDAE